MGRLKATYWSSNSVLIIRIASKWISFGRTEYWTWLTEYKKALRRFRGLFVKQQFQRFVEFCFCHQHFFLVTSHIKEETKKRSVVDFIAQFGSNTSPVIWKGLTWLFAVLWKSMTMQCSNLKWLFTVWFFWGAHFALQLFFRPLYFVGICLCTALSEVWTSTGPLLHLNSFLSQPFYCRFAGVLCCKVPKPCSWKKTQKQIVTPPPSCSTVCIMCLCWYVVLCGCISLKDLIPEDLFVANLELYQNYPTFLWHKIACVVTKWFCIV